jgi:hypothetical protein
MRARLSIHQNLLPRLLLQLMVHHHHQLQGMLQLLRGKPKIFYDSSDILIHSPSAYSSTGTVLHLQLLSKTITKIIDT